MFLPLCILVSLSFAFSDTCLNSGTNPDCPDPTAPVEIKKSDITDNVYNFCHCRYEKEITFANDVDKIPEYFFSSSTILSKIKITSSITEIGDYAFQDAKVSLPIELPSTLKSIGDGAFQCTNSDNDFKILKVSFATYTDLDSIGNYAFQSQDELEITGTITSNIIGTSAFEGCSRINAPIIISKRTYHGGKIGSNAFYGTTMLYNSLNVQKPDSHKDIEYPTIGASAFEDSGIKEIVLPHMKEINQKAFYNCDKLTGSKNELDVEKINKNAFENDALATFPTISAQSIEEGAFRNCLSLNPTSIKVLPTKHVGGSIGKEAFLNCIAFTNTLLEIVEPNEPEEGVEGEKTYSTISESAFKNSGIKKLTFPTLIDTISPSAFANCLKLEGTTNNNLIANTISANAFEGDTSLSLTSITAKEIGYKAFYLCRKLGANILIKDEPDNTETIIGGSAFEDCNILGTLTIDVSYNKERNTAELRMIGSKAFYHSGIKGNLEIPNTVFLYESAFAYCTEQKTLTFDSSYSIPYRIPTEAFYHSLVGQTIVIPRTVVSIGGSAFAYSNIKTLTIEGSVFLDSDDSFNPVYTEISDEAFYYCSDLSSLTFGDGYIQIDNEKTEDDPDYDPNIDPYYVCKTFKGCPLTSLKLGRLEKIPKEAFYGVTTLRSNIDIPDTVKEIKDRAFAECTNIPSITYTKNSNLEKIGTAAFYKCSSLSKAEIPFGVKEIEPYTYYKCISLSSVTIPDRVSTIGIYAFYGCSQLSAPLALPSKCGTIGAHAFQDCSNLVQNLKFSDELTTINEEAFMGCTKLNGDLEFGRLITTIGKHSFRDCSGLDGNLIFPEYINSAAKFSISEGAFYGCSSLRGNVPIVQRTRSGSLASLLAKNVFKGCSSFDGIFDYPEEIKSVPEGAFYGCSSLTANITGVEFTSVGKYAFYDCSSIVGSLDLHSISPKTVNEYSFYNCRSLNGNLILPDSSSVEVKDYAFYGCSNLHGNLDGEIFSKIHNYAFAKCSSLSGPLNFGENTQEIKEYAFLDCSGFSDQLSFIIDDNTDNELSIEHAAFKGCSGFKKGRLQFTVKKNEEDGKGSNRLSEFYRYNYFLKIGNDAFDGTKFKNVYYLGRFEPDCDYDIGISKTKGIHTSSNYANKTFCGNPIHSSKLSGGAIAGIVIACIVVVALIAVLIVFLILRMKKNKDNSENEVEMNQDP